MAAGDGSLRPEPQHLVSEPHTMISKAIQSFHQKLELTVYKTRGMMNAYGAFQTFYQLQLLSAQTSSNIAWIGSTQAFLMFLVSIIAGPLFDAGHLRSLLWVGSGLLVVGMFLVSITSQYWQVFVTQALSKRFSSPFHLFV